MTNTNNILVAVDSTDSNDYVMERAIEEAHREEATLVVAHLMSTAQFDDHHGEIRTIPELQKDGFTFTVDQARARARVIATQVARAAVGDLDIDYVTVGAVGQIDATLLEIADEHDCATIMLAEQRSWWRRLLGWGDYKLARTFEGQVIQVPQRGPVMADPVSPVIDG